MDPTGMSALPKMDPTLLALLERARTHVMTPEERRAQRLSFVMGMLPAENPLTREQVREILDRHDGVSPPPVASAPAALLPPDLDTPTPRWSAWSELDVDSDPSDPCCGHATVWYVGVWPADGGEPVEQVTIGSYSGCEQRARYLADQLNTAVGWTAKALADHSILARLLDDATELLHLSPDASVPGSDTYTLLHVIDGAIGWGRAIDGRTADDLRLRAAVLHERESCAFLAACHSGLWDPATIDQIAANIRARGEDSREECVHLTPARYGDLLDKEAALIRREAAAPTPADAHEAIRQALADAARDICQPGPRTLCEWQADAVMKALQDLGVIP